LQPVLGAALPTGGRTGAALNAASGA
jgi:hypothetical protein